MTRAFNPPTGWLKKLTAAGVEARPLYGGHWRTTKGARVVDFWVQTGSWRDLGLGILGSGLPSLLAHYKRSS